MLRQTFLENTCLETSQSLTIPDSTSQHRSAPTVSYYGTDTVFCTIPYLAIHTLHYSHLRYPTTPLWTVPCSTDYIPLLCLPVPYSTVRYRALQYLTVPHNTLQYLTVLYLAIPYLIKYGRFTLPCDTSPQLTLPCPPLLYHNDITSK